MLSVIIIIRIFVIRIPYSQNIPANFFELLHGQLAITVLGHHFHETVIKVFPGLGRHLHIKFLQDLAILLDRDLDLTAGFLSDWVLRGCFEDWLGLFDRCLFSWGLGDLLLLGLRFLLLSFGIFDF
jgi:hypothetical protein